jgi:molybdopterin converting factor small subunit
MSVAIRIPTQLRTLTGGVGEVYVEADNVGRALKELDANYPGFGDRIFDDTGKLRRFVNVFLNDEDIRFLNGADTVVEQGQTISIVPAVAGG